MADAFAAKVKPGRASFFSLEAQLPLKGSTNIAVAASERMTVMLKTYASGGENALHAHSNEDHSFFVLQGRAIFYGPAGEMRSIGRNEGVMLPQGTLYRFIADGDEPLVMIRVGCAVSEDCELFARVDEKGWPLAGDSTENKQVEAVLSERWFGLGNG